MNKVDRFLEHQVLAMEAEGNIEFGNMGIKDPEILAKETAHLKSKNNPKVTEVFKKRVPEMIRPLEMA